MSVAGKSGSKPLAFLTALMVLFALVVPLVGSAIANHTSADPTRVDAGLDDSAPANTCNAFTVAAFGSPNAQARGENETIDITATQSDGDTNADLQIEFCDPDGAGPGSNLGAPSGQVDPVGGGQTPNGGAPGRDCDDDANFSVEGTPNAACPAAQGPGTQEQPASIHEECTTDANGQCTFGIMSDEPGRMDVVVFYDADGSDTPTGLEPRDDMIKTWTAGAGAARNLVCNPATDTNPEGSRHEFRCTVTDAAGANVSNATVSFDVTVGPNSQEVGPTNCGNTPSGTDTTGTASPAGATTDSSGQTAAPATEQTTGGQSPAAGPAGNRNALACGYDDNLQGASNSLPGEDTIVAWVNLGPQSGQAAPTTGPDAGEPQVTLKKTWTGPERTIDCEPETATNARGTSHTITCTVRDASGLGVQGAEVDFSIVSGPGGFTPRTGGNTNVLTNASGVATVTLQTSQFDATGVTTVRGDITDSRTATNQCGAAAGQPSGVPANAPAGVCFDDVQKTWAQSVPECNDRADNDGDGLIDFGNDPGCASADDNTEAGGGTPPPGGDPEKVRHARTIQITGFDHVKIPGKKGRGLIVAGRVAAPGFAQCKQAVPVKIQIRVGGRWITRKSDVTNNRGVFRVLIRDVEARYRAVATKYLIPDEDNNLLHICQRAADTARHRSPLRH